MSELPDDLNSLFLRVDDREAVLEALASEAGRAGFAPVAPDQLLPHGRWFHGEEDPSLRRYVVSPPREGWTRVLPSVTDWHHDWTAEIAGELGCRAAYLMLHDGDVFTLHLHEGRELEAAYLSSPEHFDAEPRAPGDLGVELAAMLPFFRPGTTEERLRQALAPPGAIDIDGRQALERCAELLGVGSAALTSYALTLDEEGLELRPELRRRCAHLAFRSGSLGAGDDGDAGAAEAEGEGPRRAAPAVPRDEARPKRKGGDLLPFRPRGGGKDPGT